MKEILPLVMGLIVILSKLVIFERLRQEQGLLPMDTTFNGEIIMVFQIAVMIFFREIYNQTLVDFDRGTIMIVDIM
jgi:hypothetical protein